MSRYFKIIVCISSVVIFATGCQNKEGYSVSDSGLQYKFIEQSDTGAVVEMGGSAFVDFMIMNNKDSVVLTSRHYSPNERFIQMPIGGGAEERVLDEAFMMMKAGDSASFKISADTFFLKTLLLEKLPPYIEAGTMLTMNVRLSKTRSKADVDEERKAYMEKQKQMMQEQEAAQRAIDELKADKGKMEERRKNETTDIKKFITEKAYTEKPQKSGLYFFLKEKGTGKKAVSGNVIAVNYTGYFLDGKIFDSSIGRQPFNFTLGAQQVVPGWDEAFQLMNEGDKATIILPSSLAYGESGSGPILPYTPIAFDVELIRILK